VFLPEEAAAEVGAMRGMPRLVGDRIS